MANLTPGEEQPCQKAVRIQGVMPGLYYLGAIADYQGVVDETDEGNNTLASQSGVLQVFQGRCLLDVNAIYSGGNLTPDVKLSNLDPMRWSMTLVTSGGVNTILNRDLLVVPYVLPISFPIPLPPQGKVAVVSTLATAGGTQCFDFAVADTGGGSAVSVDQLKQAARQAGYPVP